MRAIILLLALMPESGAEDYLRGVQWVYECVAVEPGPPGIQSVCYSVLVL